MRVLRVFAVLVGLAIPAGSEAAQNDLQLFMNAIPASTNTITVIRMRSIMQSPLARREGWAKKREVEYQEGTAVLPPTSDIIVIASKLIPGNLANSPTIALMPVDQPIADRDLAVRERGSVQPVGGEFVVLSSRNCYMITKGKYLAIVSPADRQETAQWIRFVRKNREPAVTQYLQDAINADADADLMVAIDTEDILDPRLIRYALNHSELLGGANKADGLGVQALLLKLKGARLTVHFGEDIAGTLRLEFSDKVGKEGLLLKPFLKELLGDMGCEIDDFSNGQISLEENAVMIKANATLPGLRRLLSLVVPAIPRVDTRRPVQSNNPPPKPQLSPEEKEARASLAYYKNVNSMLSELQKKNRKSGDYAKTVVWHETYANKIEQLPTEYVDPELVQYGARAHNRLLGLADSLRGIAVQIQSLETGVSTNIFVGATARGPLGYSRSSPDSQFDSNVNQIRIMQAQQIAAGAGDRLKIWNMIFDDSKATATKMSTKYKVDFEPLPR
ncbi:MAG TPA: hypothetical protein VGY66_08995 [Gemmataceae bacterium]|nr:hypothetical protein [Gemmataceae bacterium]